MRMQHVALLIIDDYKAHEQCGTIDHRVMLHVTIVSSKTDVIFKITSIYIYNVDPIVILKGNKIKGGRG